MNPAYRETVFRMGGTKPDPPFWIVTAHNPNGRKTTDSENHRRDGLLYQFLVAGGETPIRATGLSPDETHAEAGWTVRDETRAREAGEFFHQEALYRIENGCLFLVDLASENEENLGDWPSRLLPS